MLYATRKGSAIYQRVGRHIGLKAQSFDQSFGVLLLRSVFRWPLPNIL
jgi:hypothetical protein